MGRPGSGGTVDAGLQLLLVEHLESIRSEAEDFGKDELAYESERLLKSLERTEQAWSTSIAGLPRGGSPLP